MTNSSRKSFNSAGTALNKLFPLTIETPRLIIREITSGDKNSFRSIINHPGFYYYCFDGTEEKLDNFIKLSQKTQKINPLKNLRDDFMLAVVLKDTKELIGHAALLNITEYKLPIQGIDYEAAYFIDVNQRGKGYGPEALINMMHYGFCQLDLPGYGSMQELDNLTAINLAEKVLGFKKVDECMGATTQGIKKHQVCIVTPDDFYTLRKKDKRPYILPHLMPENLNTMKPVM
ncbi:MAG: hypothetical protein CO093_06440 [Alphaproteobacteria bacterium CG_4_9_14_3_um_filter_47_13]|nr:MAG: hypothetical protein CO093_06440 [Alphaproteobacteria bacterium CG_4_9_14_3_um_filter_47_13]